MPSPRLWIVTLLLFVGVALPTARAESPTQPAPAASLEDALAPLTSDRLFRTARVGMQVVNVRTGEEVFARNADMELTPASTMKVLTAAAALKTLGPSYRFTTGLYADGRVLPSGVLRGNLHVKGHGDPTLVVERLWKMVYDLKLEGVTRIEGHVIYDEDFFSTDYPIPGWTKPEDLERGPSYFPPISALSVNFNTLALVVAPGPEVGEPARLQLETPAGTYVELDNQVVTSPARTRRFIQIEREIEDDKLRFTVRGRVPADASAGRYYRSVADPTAHFMAVFEEMLRAQGITVTGRHRRGTTPSTARLLVSQHSPPLAVILMDVNKRSNNFMAEQVLRAMGAEVHGLPGTTDKGLQVITDYLAELGVDPSELRLDNGSGLSRNARLRASHLNLVLVDMAHDRTVGAEFSASLAIAGRDGTLLRRLTEDPGRLRGKTGTIDGVHCLTGYIESSDGELYAFAFLTNNLRANVSQARSLHDRFARQIFDLATNGPEVVEGGED